MNLGWINDERAQDLFRRMDRENWEHVRDPARMLAIEPQERLEELALDSSFTALATSVRDELQDATYQWTQHNYLRLTPAQPAHIFVVNPTA